MNGSKFHAEAAEFIDLRIDDLVGERCRSDTSHTVRNGRGVYRCLCRNEYTIKQVRILLAESLRFPGEGKSAQG